MIDKMIANKQATLFSVMKVINENASGIAFIVDDDKKLCGTVTDGDIRRALLNDSPLDTKVENILLPDYIFGFLNDSYDTLMSKISKDDLSNENFKFGTGKKITINNKEIWAQRLSYVGELGFELYIKMNESREIYNLIVSKGKEFNLSHCGMFAMDTMRMEKGYLHWGHDMSPEENQYEAGLNFAISYKKDVDFIGKEALREISLKGPAKKLMGAEIQGDPIKVFNEEHWPVSINGQTVGSMNALVYSPRLDKNICYTILNIEHAKSGQEIIISSPEKQLMATTVDLPWLMRV